MMHLLLRQLRWSIHAEEKLTVKAPSFITFILFFSSPSSWKNQLVCKQPVTWGGVYAW